MSSKTPPKKYTFYESDPLLQEILDELVRNRELTQTIHRALLNGLGKDIQKTKQELKQRINSMEKVDKLYKRLQDENKIKTEETYKQYKQYRKTMEKSEIEYINTMGLKWIEKKADKLGKQKEAALFDFEERYKKEQKN